MIIRAIDLGKAEVIAPLMNLARNETRAISLHFEFTEIDPNFSLLAMIGQIKRLYEWLVLQFNFQTLSRASSRVKEKMPFAR